MRDLGSGLFLSFIKFIDQIFNYKKINKIVIIFGKKNNVNLLDKKFS